jgi:hypothetical protein
MITKSRGIEFDGYKGRPRAGVAMPIAEMLRFTVRVAAAPAIWLDRKMEQLTQSIRTRKKR